MIPVWVFFALGASFTVTGIPLIQERMKANGYAVAFLIKVATAILMIPFVMHHGLPSEPSFYLFTLATAALYSISDIYYFKAVPEVGAGVITRLLPVSVMITFVLWLFVDPALLDKYMSQPAQGLLITAIIVLSVYFAMRLKKCVVSTAAAKKIWFVIFAACVGPIIQKITLHQGSVAQAPFAYTFIQALMMLSFWSVFYTIRKPVSWAVLTSAHSVKTGALIGVFSATTVVLKNFAYLHAENPAYLSVILFMDSIWVILIHRMMGRDDKSDMVAGLGIVFCAMALIIAKSLY